MIIGGCPNKKVPFLNFLVKINSVLDCAVGADFTSHFHKLTKLDRCNRKTELQPAELLKLFILLEE